MLIFSLTIKMFQNSDISCTLAESTEATAATNVFKCLVQQRCDVHLAFTSARRAEMKKLSFWLHKVITNEARGQKRIKSRQPVLVRGKIKRSYGASCLQRWNK